MLWAKLITRLSQNVNVELLKQNELLKAQVLELQQHQQGRIRYTEFFKRHMARYEFRAHSNTLVIPCPTRPCLMFLSGTGSILLLTELLMILGRNFSKFI